MIVFRKFISPITRIFGLGFGHCESCGWSWKFADGKNIDINSGFGCFPICKECFYELPFEKSKKYYVKWILTYYGSITEEFLQNIESEYGKDRIRKSKIDRILK